MNFTSFKRLGLCVGAVFILIVFCNLAASINLRFHRPIGLLFLSAYTWFVAAKCKTIYPMSARAIGQLALTFLIIGLSTLSQSKHLMKTFESGDYNSTDVIHAATINAEATISATLTIGLFVLYLVLRRKAKKGRR